MGLTYFPNGVSSFGETIYGNPITSAGTKYFVSRNVENSGDGKSWDKATVIYVGEGWYSETPLTLTANDCTIISTAPGTHDPTVLYGSANAGSYDINSGGPALTIQGSNNSIINMGFFTYDVLYPAVQIGGAAGDYGGLNSCTGNKLVNCSFVRDVADGCIGGLLVACAEGPEVVGCRFSTSNKDYGIKIKSNGVINPVGVWIKDCKFIGTETGIDKDAGSDIIVEHCLFIDDTTDRADTITTPITSEGNQLIAIDNYWEFSDANAITGGGDHLNINNNTLAKT
jgi:hypothetical protein